MAHQSTFATEFITNLKALNVVKSTHAKQVCGCYECGGEQIDNIFNETKLSHSIEQSPINEGNVFRLIESDEFAKWTKIN